MPKITDLPAHVEGESNNAVDVVPIVESNETRQITISDLRGAVTESAHIIDNDVIFGYSVSDVQTQVSGWDASGSVGNALTPDPAAGTITVNEAGRYVIAAAISMDMTNLDTSEYITMMVNKNWSGASPDDGWLSTTKEKVPSDNTRTTVFSFGSVVASDFEIGDVITIGFQRITTSKTGAIATFIGISSIEMRKL